MYPNTHCSGIGKSKGLQWVLSDATVVFTGAYMGSPRIYYSLKHHVRMCLSLTEFLRTSLFTNLNHKNVKVSNSPGYNMVRDVGRCLICHEFADSQCEGCLCSCCSSHLETMVITWQHSEEWCPNCRRDNRPRRDD